ncbi:hypothetical protein VFPPC_18264 [Pochonia chlamydosporia 170]|uniref:Uncharacterized protein n=1 Tax=Pochonia chlamydosporia 170 TaxID=1380566 RepID=A0A219AP44_METCM|nr:hypothetical protein VFPPC_18264 [Pochonia chlamydosporia 170]OWT42596.1 hypothetical protein VFPPC_18264 [Pochonia chlamydosporia 170]
MEHPPRQTMINHTPLPPATAPTKYRPATNPAKLHVRFSGGGDLRYGGGWAVSAYLSFGVFVVKTLRGKGQVCLLVNDRIFPGKVAAGEFMWLAGSCVVDFGD